MRPRRLLITPQAIWSPAGRTHKSEDGYLTFYKLFDQHYREFLSASSVLASLVPPGLREVHDDIWLVSFMDYDLGYFDLETRVLEPLENPFGPKVLPMCRYTLLPMFPGGFELPTFWFVAVTLTKTKNLHHLRPVTRFCYKSLRHKDLTVHVSHLPANGRGCW